MANASVIDLFKTQLNEELSRLAIKGNHVNLKTGDPDAGMAFPHWYFQRIELRTAEESADLVFDGFDDRKIDAIDISEDQSTVRFFQFKNPTSKGKGFDDAAVHGLLLSLDLIMSKKRIAAKTPIEEKLLEIKSAIRTSYKLIFVSSGGGLSSGQRKDITDKLKSLNSGNPGPFAYEVIDINTLQDLAYGRSLPTVHNSMTWEVPQNSYQAKFGEHKSMILHVSGELLASEYQKYGEKLLQQNIRNSEGLTSSNLDIYKSAISGDSGKFYFYNNGISIICEDWVYDSFSSRIEIKKPQIVNGGQTIRQIHKAHSEKKLKKDVNVIVRIMSSAGDRQFAGNIAVYLNNQTTVKAALLRSNHQFFMQMQQTLLTMNWYLERRPGDWNNLTESEQSDLLAKIGDDDKIIPLQIGCQAFCAYQMQDIVLAKKNPKDIFISKANGGRFEDVISDQFTAEALIRAYSAYQFVEKSKKELKKIAQKKPAERTRLFKSEYGVAPIKYEDLCLALPQATLFITGLMNNEKAADTKGFNKRYLGKVVSTMIAQKKKNKSSWPTNLKNQSLFAAVSSKL